MPSIADSSRRSTSFGKSSMTVQIKADRGVSAETRIGRQIKPQPNGCWLWDNDKIIRPNISARGENVMAYRFVYETLVGPIPKGHVLHHTCEAPLCCNPKHLVPMTNGDHVAMHHAQRKAARRAA